MSRAADNEPIPYGRQWVDDDDVAAVTAALRSDRLTQGPCVEEFEDALAQRCGAAQAVAVCNGTAALHLACLAAGIGPGDEVVTSPLTFAASANCALYAGAEARFADVRPDTGCMDAADLASRVTERTRAVVPVHYAGHPCDTDRIAEVARRAGAVVIEDACHALGAEHLGRSVGSCEHADMTVFSFHPVKHVTTGEGGAVLTNDDALAERLRTLRHHGIVADPARQRFRGEEDGGWYYEVGELGHNFRITDLQCALGTSQLRKLDAWVARRREIKAAYDEAFAGLPGVDVPAETPGAISSWHLYPLRVPAERRRAVYDGLHARGILVQVHYVPVHLMPVYRDRYGHGPGDFPAAEAYYAREISLPMFPALTDAQVARVVDAVTEMVGGAR